MFWSKKGEEWPGRVCGFGWGFGVCQFSIPVWHASVIFLSLVLSISCHFSDVFLSFFHHFSCHFSFISPDDSFWIAESFIARARIPPGQTFMFAGVWGCGVGGFAGCGLTKTKTKRNMLYKLTNDAQTDTQICKIHFETIQKVTESKQGHHKSGTPEARTPGTEFVYLVRRRFG